MFPVSGDVRNDEKGNKIDGKICHRAGPRFILLTFSVKEKERRALRNRTARNAFHCPNLIKYFAVTFQSSEHGSLAVGISVRMQFNFRPRNARQTRLKCINFNNPITFLFFGPSPLRLFASRPLRSRLAGSFFFVCLLAPRPKPKNKSHRRKRPDRRNDCEVTSDERSIPSPCPANDIEKKKVDRRR